MERVTTASASGFLSRCALGWLEHGGRQPFSVGRPPPKRWLTALRPALFLGPQAAEIDFGLQGAPIWKKNSALGWLSSAIVTLSWASKLGYI